MKIEQIPKNKKGFQKGHRPFVNWKGRKHTEESKKKMSKAKKGKPSKKLNKGKGWISNGYMLKQVNKKAKLIHHIVWCSQQNNLNYIPKGFIIHHLDLNRLNNNSNNLLLMNRSDHTKLHEVIRHAS